MAKTTNLYIRLEPGLKEQADADLRDLNLGTGDSKRKGSYTSKSLAGMRMYKYSIKL